MKFPEYRPSKDFHPGADPDKSIKSGFKVLGFFGGGIVLLLASVLLLLLALFGLVR